MRTAVFLLNLGGPRNLGEVEAYLVDLFSDPLVITAPLGPLRKPLARFIARRRAPSSAEKYQLIGGRSPLVEGTEAQARALSAALGPGFSCHLAMRCGHPNTEEGVREALAAGAERALALPLYPQWANATTWSSLLELRRVWTALAPGRPLAEVCTWHDHAGYLDALAVTVREALSRLPPGPPRFVVFSAHGLPMSQVRRGDPYPKYVELSARGAAERCGLAPAEWTVTYQSRVGPTKWLGPDTVEFIERSVRGKALVTVPVAFVSEHLETLYDLDVLAKEAAAKGGAAAYARAAALGDRPDFVAALADIVRGGLDASRSAA
jgi:ferrochelatase